MSVELHYHALPVLPNLSQTVEARVPAWYSTGEYIVVGNTAGTAWIRIPVYSDLTDHVNNAVQHVTALERTAWNGKAAGKHSHVLADVSDLADLGLTYAAKAHSHVPLRIIFGLSGLQTDDRASLILEFNSDPAFPADTAIAMDSAVSDDNAHFHVWSGTELAAWPAAGVNSVYPQGIVDVPADAAAWTKDHIHYRWHWRSEAGATAGSESSMRYGCLQSLTHEIDMASAGFGA